MSKPTRREFLKKTVLGAVGTGMALTVFRPENLLANPQVGDRRGYAAGKYALELDGIMAGWLYSVEGGHATSDVVNEKIGPNNLRKKPIGNVKYEDITLACGTGMSKAFYEWIKAAIGHQSLRKNGAIVTSDYNYKEISRIEWNDALITEVGFPSLDAASKDAAKMTIKFRPEFTRMTAKPGGQVAGAITAPKVQKKWLPSNFRLQIANLDCTKVNKIEAITVRQTGAAPNLVITLAEASATGFFNWQKESVMSGKNSKANAKTGQLDYLTEDLREPLFTLHFQNLGLFKLTPEKVEAGGENIRRVNAEMYCESIQFTYSSSAWA
jgi:phage tail-like protein